MLENPEEDDVSDAGGGPVRFLARFGRPHRMQELFERGSLQLNDMESFTKSDEPGRGDPDEGLWTDFEEGVSSGFVLLKVGGRRAHVTRSRLFGPWQTCGVYCMSYLEAESPMLDAVQAVVLKHAAQTEFPREQWSACVVMLDGNEFIRRFRETAASAGHEVVTGPVRYAPDPRTEIWTPFHKTEKFAWQREFRIATTMPIQKQLRLELGPLDDIAAYYEIGWGGDAR